MILTDTSRLPMEAGKVESETTDAFKSALEAEDAAKKVFQLSYVFFNTGSAELDNGSSKYQLDKLAAILADNPTVKIELGGHTDNTGDAENNQTLSKARAESVYNYLASKGVDASRMSAVGYGQNSPIDTNDTEEGRANNRRTEFKIVEQ
ncbi:MAG: OmpA family protein [Saprospiraceae bacterium]